MNKRIQIILSDEAAGVVNKLLEEVKDGFKVGTIKTSDLVSEMIVNSKVDIKELRSKYTDLRKSLKELANMENVDMDIVMKALSDLKGRSSKKTLKLSSLAEGSVE